MARREKGDGEFEYTPSAAQLHKRGYKQGLDGMWRKSVKLVTGPGRLQTVTLTRSANRRLLKRK